MLHALGITHVVSVGECALIPPPPDSSAGMAVPPSAAKMHSPASACGGSDQRGSLYIEEREGRIKVLDIKGICDDGIDTLEPQLAPICDWIDRAREQGGKVLVHCRVGVSRSATVTIAYVMKYLRISLIEAYLIVRSRRLSVLIQPNMRLLYNLCGWEVRLAHERAAGETDRLRKELARCANWPYLAREVHLLNDPPSPLCSCFIFCFFGLSPPSPILVPCVLVSLPPASPPHTASTPYKIHPPLPSTRTP